jgi:hypothetical protein
VLPTPAASESPRTQNRSVLGVVIDEYNAGAASLFPGTPPGPARGAAGLRQLADLAGDRHRRWGELPQGGHQVRGLDERHVRDVPPRHLAPLAVPDDDQAGPADFQPRR